MSDKIISFQAKVEQRLKALEESRGQLSELTISDLPSPSIEDVSAFLKVIGYLRQISDDGTGSIEFDPFCARVALDSNRLDFEDDTPQINVGVAIEGVLPLSWCAVTEEEVAQVKAIEGEDVVSFDECAEVAHDIIEQLGYALISTDPEDDVH